MPDSREALNEHGSCGISRVKLPCSSKESFSLDSRVGASSNSMAHVFSISRDSSWEIIVGSQSWSRTNFLGPEGRGSNSIGGLGGVSNSDIYMGSTGSSSSLMNSSTSFSRRDSGESTRRIHVTSSIGSESRYGSIMEFVALTIWTEMVSFPRWTLSLF